MSGTGRKLQKRMLDEAEDVEDLVKPKSIRIDETETDSSDTSTSVSSSSTLLSSDNEQTASGTTSSTDVHVSSNPLTDSLELHSQVDAWKC